MALGAFIFGAGAVLIVGAAIAFACDELSQKEQHRQEIMRAEYHDYERRKRQEYRDTCNYYENARKNSEEEYYKALSEYQLELIQRRKNENRGTYKKLLSLHDEQYTEKNRLLDECRKIVELCEKSIGKQQNSYVRFKSIKSTLISLQEAVYKLEAYIRYLDNYKKGLIEIFEDSGEISSPFSMTLPTDYPYEGKVFYFSRNEFQNYGYVFADAGYIRLDKSDHEMFETCLDNVKLPFMVYASKKGQLFLSLSKGLVKNSIGGTIGIDAEVIEVLSKSIRLRFSSNDYLFINIWKQDLINQRRRTPKGSNLHVYVKDYDFALKKPIIVSERVGDGLTIAQFTNIALLQTSDERKELFDYLEKNDLLEEDDEWRIGPIMDEDKKLIGLIMQIGYSYAFKAYFEEFCDGGLILRYAGMLPKEDLISFDDIFVATNVTLDCYTPKQVEQDIEKYENYFQECEKLQLYLISEFATQSRIMAKSPMSVYLSQWEEITNRLIEILSYGSHILVSVAEWNYFTIREIGNYTILKIDSSNKILQFVEKEHARSRYKFFIAIDGDEIEKIPCNVINNEDGTVALRLKGEIDADTLLDNDFMLDMYSVAVPYAEKQQAHAFSMFKEGRVVSEEVKIAIVNTTSIQYEDNGYHVQALFNKNIQTNQAQLDAVVRAFGEGHFFLIQGPPGTGKTTVIKELILQQLTRESSSRILVVSQANVAVDNVLRGIVEISDVTKYVNSTQIVRCGTPDKIADDIEEYSFDKKFEKYKEKLTIYQTLDDEVKALRQKWIKIIEDKNNADIVGECLLSCFQIIGATCVGLESRHYGLNGMEFDLVIIDEAGKALAGELLIPINHAKKAIIIGDHKQLPPVINPALYKGGSVKYDDVVEEEAQLDFLNRSFFQRLYEDCPDELKCMLNIQFRMPPIIADLVNMFYDGTLKSGENCKSKKPIFLGNHLIFVDMQNVKEYKEKQDTRGDGGKSSPYNEKEVEAAVAIVSKIRLYYKKRIVVITPYKRQKFLLIKGFRNSGLENVWINTIDAFQGDEEDVVIYCTTRAVKETRYFSDSARLNVAFSRARNTLIFLGSSRYLKKYPEEHILHRISNYLESKATIIQYDEWLHPEFDIHYNASYENAAEPLMCANRMLDIEKIRTDFFESVNIKKEVQAVCAACGTVLEEEEYILCEKCIGKFETYQCKCCGQNIKLSFYDKYVHGDKAPELCDNCETVNCFECGKSFFMQKKKRNDLMAKGKKVLCSDCHSKYQEIVYRKQCANNCGKEIALTYAAVKRMQENGKKLPTICQPCRKKGSELVSVGACQVCGKAITVKRYQLEKHSDSINTEMHIECSKKTYLPNRKCDSCGKMFCISYGEKAFYDRMGYELPKRCEVCRKKRI